jgi:hypothetical protein
LALTRKQIIFRERLILLLSLIIGVLVLPNILMLIINKNFVDYGLILLIFANTETPALLLAWIMIIILSPYYLIQIIRMTKWYFKQPRKQ